MTRNHSLSRPPAQTSILSRSTSRDSGYEASGDEDTESLLSSSGSLASSSSIDEDSDYDSEIEPLEHKTQAGDVKPSLSTADLLTSLDPTQSLAVKTQSKNNGPAALTSPQNPIAAKEAIQGILDEGFLTSTAERLLKETETQLHDDKRAFFNVALKQTISTCKLEGKAIDYGTAANLLNQFADQLEKGRALNEQSTTHGKEDTQTRVRAYRSLAFLMRHKFRAMVFAQSKQALHTHLKNLENPDTKKVQEKSLSFAGSAGLMSLEEKISLSNIFTGSDDTKIRTFKGKEITLKLKIGKGLSAHGAVSFQYGTGKTFKNLDDFVDYFADKMVDEMVQSLPSPEYAQLISGQRQHHILASQEKKIALNTAALLQPFEELGLIDSKDVELVYERRRIAPPNELKRKKLSAKAGISIANTVSGEQGFSWSEDRFTKRVPLIQQIKEHPELLPESPPGFFSIGFKENKSSVTLGSLASAIRSNHEEYKDYCDLCRAPDKHNQIKRKAIETRRGFNHHKQKPEPVLRSMMITHAQLLNTYKEVLKTQESLWVTPDTPLAEDELKDLERSFENPQLIIDDKQFHKHLMGAKKLKSYSADYHAKASLNCMGVEVSGNFHYHSRYNDPNPDNDGNYATITLNFSITGVITNNSFVLNQLKHAIKEQMQLPDGSSIDISSIAPNLNLMITHKKEASIKLKYIKHGEKFHLQYTRDLSGSSQEVGLTKSTEIIPLSLGIKGKETLIDFKREVLGSNTITYLQKRFNGWKAGKKDENWSDFVNSLQYKKEIENIICKMATSGTHPNDELSQLIDEINYQSDGTGSKAVSEAQQAFQALREHRNNDPEGTFYQNAIKALEDLFSAYFPIYQKAGASRFTDVSPTEK